VGPSILTCFELWTSGGEGGGGVLASIRIPHWVQDGVLHVGHTGTHLITKVKQLCAQLVIGWETTQMMGVVKRCSGFMWPEKGSENTPKGVILPV
jgi:hypothetical protein